MKLTVVFDDKYICKDDVSYTVAADDWTLNQTNVHAVQWDGTSGHIEFKDGTANQLVTHENEISEYDAFFRTIDAREVSRNSIDTRYFTVGPLDEANNFYPAIPKPISQLHTERVLAIKERANDLLKPSDWFVIRSLELGPIDTSGAVPAAVSDYRSQVRAVSNSACEAILAATDFIEVAQAEAVVWPTSPDSSTYYLDV